MNLVDIILQNVDVVDYYEDYIRPMEPKFQPYSMVGNKLVLCCFHDHMDLNPSFGYYTKKENGISYKLYHCFGCHKTGNVIRLHQQMQYQYYQKKLTEKEACLELAKLYDINVEDFEDISDDGLFYVGRSYMDSPDTDGVIYVNKAEENLINKFVKCKIVDCNEYDLFAEML